MPQNPFPVLIPNWNVYLNRITPVEVLSLDWFRKPCSEFVHQHLGNSCDRYGLEVWKDTFIAAIKIYGPLYFVFTLMSKKKPVELLKKVLISALRSSVFFATNDGLYSRFTCLLFELAGQRNHRAIFFVAPFLASLASIYIETKSRRRELAVYMTNQAAETTFKMLLSRGWFTYMPFKEGKRLLFSLACAILLYFYNYSPEDLSSSIYSLLKVIFGSKSQTSQGDWIENRVRNVTKPVLILRNKSNQNNSLILPDAFENILLSYSHSRFMFWFNGFVRGFLIGYFVKSLLSFLPTLFQPASFAHSWRHFISKSFGVKSLNFGYFIALMVGVPRLFKMILLLLFRRQHPLIELASGFLGGWFSSKIASSTEVTMYIGAKAVEAIVQKLVRNHKLPRIPHFVELLYANSSAILLYAAEIEPFSLRSSYRNFLAKASGWHYARFSESDGIRALRIIFGTEDLKLNYLRFKKES